MQCTMHMYMYNVNIMHYVICMYICYYYMLYAMYNVNIMHYVICIFLHKTVCSSGKCYFSILASYYQRNANQHHYEVPFHTSQNGCDPKVYKCDLLQEVLPDFHPLQAGEVFLCSGLP